jgi:hypothetical protein
LSRALEKRSDRVTCLMRISASPVPELMAGKKSLLLRFPSCRWHR